MKNTHEACLRHADICTVLPVGEATDRLMEKAFSLDYYRRRVQDPYVVELMYLFHNNPTETNAQRLHMAIWYPRDNQITPGF